MAAVDDVVVDDDKLVIVDTDVGVDDACALLLLLSRSRTAEQPLRPVQVLAITTVSGNVGVDQVCRNVRRVLRVADRLDIPIYRGMETSYARVDEDREPHDHSYHGKDGLGDVADSDDSSEVEVQKEHAALAIIRLVHQHPGRVSLLCLGPLTNVALALCLEPNLGKSLRDCYIMGGNYTAKGNVTPCAEFNFFSDPEAADVVLKQLRCPISMVTWELCIDNALSWEWLREYTSSVDSARGRFVSAIVSSTVEHYYSGEKNSAIEDRKQYVTCDEIAAALVIDERRLVTHISEVVLCGVEQTGRATRGQLVLDWKKKMMKMKMSKDLHAENDEAIVLKLVTGIDIDLLQKMLIDSLSA